MSNEGEEDAVAVVAVLLFANEDDDEVDAAVSRSIIPSSSVDDARERNRSLIFLSSSSSGSFARFAELGRRNCGRGGRDDIGSTRSRPTEFTGSSIARRSLVSSSDAKLASPPVAVALLQRASDDATIERILIPGNVASRFGTSIIIADAEAVVAGAGRDGCGAAPVAAAPVAAATPPPIAFPPRADAAAAAVAKFAVVVVGAAVEGGGRTTPPKENAIVSFKCPNPE
jgi:hypothetical protein